MKGIVLAGGQGSRLYPATLAVSKQLLPIHDKPLIYYSLSVLLLSGIREILIVSQSQFLPLYKKLFGTGDRLGIRIEYRAQDEPRGIAEAFLIGEDFIDGENVALVLGDNVFYGQGFSPVLRRAVKNEDVATLFAYRVNNPQEFGVVTFDAQGSAKSIVEKPASPGSNFAVTGLYFYPNDVVGKARNLTPSSRGELEISAINQAYLEEKRVSVQILGRGFAWLDTGLPKSLLDASHFIETIENRQGIKVACLEEIAYQNGWIDLPSVRASATAFGNSDYGRYLRQISLSENEDARGGE